jgi:hypothetical protein
MMPFIIRHEDLTVVITPHPWLLKLAMGFHHAANAINKESDSGPSACGLKTPVRSGLWAKDVCCPTIEVSSPTPP